ncbi:hypothetical protein LTR78_004762 [Recurvomyces mirabilis]|uniref:Uncharacterized protein n=1 Tax=Recurvomyces mirabilis TaxID=574656 RepID=A0AAE0WP07_9PEZI|nr:hypothetical protein LTR78_004762 [Recurvomyces mirabilis]KAK5157933.1 hypothetical protein LTS14_003856 [Recurvomyces mirabilis]
MKFLVTSEAPGIDSLVRDLVHVNFCAPASDLSAALTGPETINVWICHGAEVTEELLDRWVNQARTTSKSILVEDSSVVSRLQTYSKGRLAEIVTFPPQYQPHSEWAESLLRAGEMIYIRAHVSAPGPQRARETARMHGRKVLLVGAGILNLITAELLASKGFHVQIVDAGPDPRKCEDWTRLGVTNGGGNARMFTSTEADNYNEKGSELYQNMRTIFRHTARNGGWSVKRPELFNAAEQAWVQSFEQVPDWLARAFKEDIHAVNRTSGQLWRELMDTAPDLFDGVQLREGILRMYAEQKPLEAALAMNRSLNTIVEDTSPESFLAAFPGFAPAVETDDLAGGFIIDGFTVNIHPFMSRLMDRITKLGGQFSWDCRVERIVRNSIGNVTMLETHSEPLFADDFIISPGVTGNTLLRGTKCEDLIQGVLGVWLQIPNLHPQLKHSLKIHRRGHLVEDINVTVAKNLTTGEDELMLGGGYGYTGQDRPPPDCPELMALFEELKEVARIYFPRGHAMAVERGTMWPNEQRKYCIRPFTATGLGVFERIPTTSGGNLIITGGNNTGGFAQAPAVARAVWRGLVGEHDPIHELFHPDRGRLPTVTANKSQVVRPLAQRITHASSPLKVLLLCSDGPQHHYLRRRVAKLCPNFRCIVETSEGQVRYLKRKGRMFDAAFMQYHTLRRHMFGQDTQRMAYFDGLMSEKHELPSPDLVVDNLNCREVWDTVERWQPELTIVSGTKYIGRKLNERAGLMINLHIGHLPEYKGNHCIFFALYDGAPQHVAATLHQLTPDLDGGNILDVVSPEILPTDNENTLYTRCLHLAIDRCMEHVQRFSRGQTLVLSPQPTSGKIFRHTDRTPMKELWLWLTTAFFGLPQEKSVGCGQTHFPFW